MKEKLIKVFDFIEYAVIGISLVGMILATVGMLFSYDNIKKENMELKSKQEIAIYKCKQDNKKCEEVKWKLMTELLEYLF